MKKDVKIIIGLLLLIVLLFGGIFVVIKTDLFSPNVKETTLKDDGQSKDDVQKENEETKEPENNAAEEKEPEVVEPPKVEEQQKEEKPKADVSNPNVVKTNNNNNNNNNQSNNQNPNNNQDNNGNNKVESEPQKPVEIVPINMTCSTSEMEEDVKVTNKIVAQFDGSDKIIRSLRIEYVFDYSENYEPFDSTTRQTLEQEYKNFVVGIYGDLKDALLIDTNSNGNVINVILSSDYDRLYKVDLKGFENGDYLYENARSQFVQGGYVCN